MSKTAPRHDGGKLFLRADDLATRWKIHPVTVWKWVSKGILPPPTKLGPNVRGWDSDVIKQYEASRTPMPAVARFRPGTLEAENG